MRFSILSIFISMFRLYILVSNKSDLIKRYCYYKYVQRYKCYI